MKHLIKKCVEDLDFNSGALMVPSKANPEILECSVYYNLPEVWKNITNKIEDNPSNINGFAAYTLKPIIKNNIDKLLHGYLVSSVIFMPISKDGKFIANLELISDKGKTVSENDLEYLKNKSEEFIRALS